MTVLCLTLHYLRLGLWTDSDVGVDPGWTLCVCVWSADGVTPQPLSGGHPSCVTQRIKDWLKKKSHLLWVPVPLCSQRKPWTGLRGPRGLQGIRSRSNLEGNAPEETYCVYCISGYTAFVLLFWGEVEIGSVKARPCGPYQLRIYQWVQLKMLLTTA